LKEVEMSNFTRRLMPICWPIAQPRCWFQ
jgi:hypothetical protein